VAFTFDVFHCLAKKGHFFVPGNFRTPPGGAAVKDRRQATA
jgi:hypothetical protein